MSQEFKPRVHEHTITSGDDKKTFYIREASGREVLKAMASKATKTPEDNQRETFRFVVKDADGTPLSADEINALLDLRFRVMLDLQKAVLKLSGLQSTVNDAEKEAEAKRMAEVAQRVRDNVNDPEALLALADELERGPEKND